MGLDNLSSLLNRPAASVIVEQMRKLYMRLYPYMTNDFVHMADLNIAIKQLDAKIQAVAAFSTGHVHPIVPNAPISGPPAGGPIPLPPTVATPNIAHSLVVLPGVPQPTGEAIPAVLPVRVGPPTEQVAIPPISPAELSGLV